MLRRFISIFVIGLLFSLTGCASTSVQSNIAEDFVGPVDKAFVVAKVSGSWSENYIRELVKEVNLRVGKCLPISVHVVSPLTLDPNDIDKAMDSFGSRYTLLLEQTTEKTVSRGIFGDAPRGFIFNVQLIDMSTERTIWRAVFDSGGGSEDRSEYIYSMTKSLAETMIKDGIINCAENND